MLSRFFIDRPIFANVIAIVTMILGGVALFRLPVEQYPSITPPTVQVTATYPGANAQVLSDTVAAPIEQQVNGVEGMLYMSSTCASDGTYTLTVTFEVGANLDMAQVLVQNRVSQAEPRLPEDVRRQGINVKKQSTAIIQVVTLTSDEGKFDSLYLSNYATLSIRDELARIYGVGEIQVFGSSDYGMRVWLDPNKLKARNLSASDVVAAIQEQNVQVAAGQLGAAPAPVGQDFEYTITTLGRLSDVEAFNDIIVKTAPGNGGRLTRVRDVARVELGGQLYNLYCEKSGIPAAGLAIFQLPGANSLNVAHDVKQVMVKLAENFPKGLNYDIPFDTTKFVEEAIAEVYKTLFEAGVLVLIVILVFLQDWRAVLVPATTVPVTIIGAFALMWAMGFSVNMLTLFGLVLAIGIVVDDAIVIVENAAHHIEHDHLAPREATIVAMGEILGPIIGITLVLMAVFLPTAGMQGITGQLYRQFALTIAATALISAVNALTLKPAQCAVYLRPVAPKKNVFYRGFNAVYDFFEGIYVSIVKLLVRAPFFSMIAYLAIVTSTVLLFRSLPTGFLPTEDQGYLVVGCQLPDGASQERTQAVLQKMNKILGSTPGIENWVTIGGQSLLDQAASSNAATIYVTLKEWSHRQSPEESLFGVLGSLYGQFATIDDAITFAFPPPAILGLGTAGGFEMQLQDRGGAGLVQLQNMAQIISADANQQTALTQVNSTFRAQIPQIYLDIDRVKAKSLDVPLAEIFGTLQAELGSAYVNDFNLFGRTYQVRIQADAQFRVEKTDITRLQVRNRAGQMVPLGSLVEVRDSLGPQIIRRYNLYPAAAINGQAAPGFSSGQALDIMEQMTKRLLPKTMGFEWTGISYQERKVGNESVYVLGLAVLLVYLVLAAQYESWTSPAAVILVVPLGLVGSGLALLARGMDNNVYTQIGLVLIIALASKNAILIVEFARDLRHKGASILDAAVDASRLRFRPILMTSFAFILGVYPLVVAQGAGAASRQALGTAVFGGMITSTILAVFFTPVFYVVMQSLSEGYARLRGKPVRTGPPSTEAAQPAATHDQQPASH